MSDGSQGEGPPGEADAGDLLVEPGSVALPVGEGEVAPLVPPCEVELADPEATLALGQRLGASLGPGDVVALAGALGAGKTLLVRGACVALGVDEREVTSPTYTLVHYYEGRVPVVHADLYRLGAAAHPDELGLSEELLEGEAVLFVEWPASFVGYLPAEAWNIELAETPEGGRRARIRRGGDEEE